MAYFAVPDEFKNFVMYQTVYVIVLGLAAGYRRLKANSVLAAILIHFGFNLGFYIASQAL